MGSRFVAELTPIIDTLNDLMDDAEDCGETAVAQKIAEAIGPLRMARLAGKQYANGTLTV